MHSSHDPHTRTHYTTDNGNNDPRPETQTCPKNQRRNMQQLRWNNASNASSVTTHRPYIQDTLFSSGEMKGEMSAQRDTPRKTPPLTDPIRILVFPPLAIR